MHRIDTPGNDLGRFRAGNPIAGVESTIVGADWTNAVADEIIAVIENSGLTLQKTNNAQRWQAIQAGASAGVSVADRAQVDAVAPLAAPGPSVQRILAAVGWQGTTTAPGFAFPYTELGQPITFSKLARASIPAGALAEGGSIRLYLTGEFTPGSTDPTLAIKATLGGTLLRPRQPIAAGDTGVDGWLYNSLSMGLNALDRLAADTRWVLDVEITSLGRYSKAAGSFPTGDATILVEGSFRIGDLEYPGGDSVLFHPFGGGGSHDLWTIGRVYTVGDRVRHVGQTWITWVDHTGSATDEPGVADLVFREFWRPTVFVVPIWQTNVVDLADWVGLTATPTIAEPLTLEIDVGGPVVDPSSPAPSAWVITTGYTIDHPRGSGSLVTSASKLWRCMETHTSSGTDEPGVDAGALRFWVEYGGANGFGIDAAICDAIQIKHTAGAGGREALLF